MGKTPAEPTRSLPAWSFCLLPAAAATLAALWVSSRVFGRIPHVQDSIAQLFQARIFALGRLSAEAPPSPEFFEYTHMILKSGRWYSQYPPGHSVSLLVGVLFGAPWVVNPLLGGLAVVATYFLAAELFDRRTARLAAVLAPFSPFLLFMSSEFMAHASSLTAATLFLWFYFRAHRTGSLRIGLASGAALAWLLLVRPYSGLAVAAPIVLHALFSLFAGARSAGNARASRAALLGIAAGGALGVALLLLYNLGTTGHATRFGYEELYGSSHGVGLGKGSWGPPLTLARGLAQVGNNFVALHRQLFAWPIGSLWPAALAVALGLIARWRSLQRGDLETRAAGQDAARDLWLFATVLSLGAFHVFYWYQDFCFGPRYLYEALGPILILSARGLLAVLEWVRQRVHAMPHANGKRRATSNGHMAWPTVLCAVLLALLFGSAFAFEWPKLLRPPAAHAGKPLGSGERLASYFEYYGRTFWGVDPHLGQAVDRLPVARVLVFVRTLEPDLSALQVRYLFFGSAFARQSPDFEHTRVIYARDLGARNSELIARFPDRAAYLFEGSIENGRLRRLESGH